MTKQFKTGSAFKMALEDHLRRRAAERAIPFNTLQLRFIIERLLAQLFRSDSPPWLLKGGFAMDLRFRPRARTTKDIDLSVAVLSTAAGPKLIALGNQLQQALDTDLGDFLTYRIGTPKKELTNAPGGGGRYPCEAILLGKTYAKLHIDVGIGDALVGQPDHLVGEDILDFAGVGPAAVWAIPMPQQFAEKVHAYTYPWGNRVNTRTKDLVDLVLLLERGELDTSQLRVALKETFGTRHTHPLPKTLAPPPASWEADFKGMAEEAGLSIPEYLDAFSLLEDFWARHALGADEG